jgi:DNA-binding GntR family transcriptional regulator
VNARIKKVSLPDSVAAILRERIVNGELAPGDPLNIELVAAELGVSRTPVREGLAKLESMGLVNRNAGHVPTVFEPSRENALEYYEMRMALEPLAGRLAVPRVTDEVVEEMRQLVDEMDTYVPSTWFGLNRRFHEALYAVAQRPYHLQVIDGLIDRSDPYIRLYFGDHDLEVTQLGHRAILDAVVARDAERVTAAIHQHLEDVVSGLFGSLGGDGA